MKRVLVAALIGAIAPAQAATTAITNALLCNGGNGCVAGQTILIRDGKIAAVGASLAIPAGSDVVDAQGRAVTPGLIDAYSRLGTVEVEAVEETDDGDAGKAPFSAAFDVALGLNPQASALAITRMRGVTRAVVVPGDSAHLFNGFGAIIDLSDGPNILVRGKAFQAIDMGEDGASRSGGSRADTLVTFANALNEAAAYRRYGFRTFVGGEREALTDRLDTEALLPVLDGASPLLVKAQRASDIRAVLALRSSFPKLKIILAGASEGWMVASEIAAAKVPVILYALDNLPREFESTAATMANAARLKRAGVEVALGSFDQQQNAQLMQQYAANLTSLPGDDALGDPQALDLITGAPARIFGLNSGRIEAGRAADVVIWDGVPLDIMSAPVAVYIDGVPVTLESRQSKLRDRYLPVARRQATPLPVQYSR